MLFPEGLEGHLKVEDVEKGLSCQSEYTNRVAKIQADLQKARH